jgi:ADP-heptose:LPS heptosyltransferase
MITRFSSMGDIVLTTPVIRALRRRFPDARIDYATKPQFAELLSGNPHLHAVHVYDSGSGLTGLRAFGRQLREHGCDLLVDLHNNLRTRLLQVMIRPQRTARYSKHLIRRTLLVQTGLNCYPRPILQLPERYLRPLRAFGVDNDGAGLELFPNARQRETVAALLRQAQVSAGDLVIGLGPIASFPLKQWPVERFAEVGRALVRRYGARIVLLGGTLDIAQVRPLAAQIPNNPILLCGQLSLLESAAALERCALFVGNDTGAMHMAAAMGCKVVALFGPTVEELGFYPYGVPSEVVSIPLPCRPCTHTGQGRCKIGTHACLRDIPANQVLDAVERLGFYSPVATR